jgi:hypothetical protein
VKPATLLVLEEVRAAIHVTRQDHFPRALSAAIAVAHHLILRTEHGERLAFAEKQTVALACEEQGCGTVS